MARTSPSLDMIAADLLIPDDRNSRTHSPEQVEQLKASIRKFGFNTPLGVVHESDGAVGIVVGHGRWLAAQEMWASGEEVPGPGKRAPLPKGKLPTLDLSGLSPEERRAYLIADNQLALNAGWNFEILGDELRLLDEAGFDMPVIGFDEDSLADLLFVEPETVGDPDAAPPLPVEPVSRVGDCWQIGDHRLLCGSAEVETDVSRLLGDEVPGLMVTDPPYGVEYDPSWRKSAGLAGKVAEGLVSNDDRADWRDAWALFPGTVAYVWHGGLHSVEVAASLEAVKLLPRAQIVWVKGRAAISQGAYHWQHEPALYAVKEGADDDWQEESSADDRFVEEHEIAVYAVKKGQPARYRGGRKQTTVWQIDHLKNDTGHGTQKPVECMRRPIENNSAPGAAVYEPFCGSGTTIIAAHMTGRRCFALEIDPAYIDVAVRRWQAFTGKEAVLADGEDAGRTFADLEAGRKG